MNSRIVRKRFAVVPIISNSVMFLHQKNEIQFQMTQYLQAYGKTAQRIICHAFRYVRIVHSTCYFLFFSVQCTTHTFVCVKHIGFV